MSATIKIFQVGKKSFSHVMNGNHDSVELRNDENETLLTFGDNARASNQHGQMGSFLLEFLDGRPHWVYYELPLQTRYVCSPDLHTAEVEVSKRFIGSVASLGRDAIN